MLGNKHFHKFILPPLTESERKGPLQLHTTRVYPKFWGHHADQVFINALVVYTDVFADNVSHSQSAQTL